MLGGCGASLVAAKIAAEALGGESAAAACLKKNSFTGDTPVLMADGPSKPIAEVKIGDEFRNAEPDDSFTEHHVVIALHVTDGHDFVGVTVATSSGLQTIISTAHHPFWNTTSHAWTDATDLGLGDQLSMPSGGRIAVQGLRRYTAGCRTCSLTVDAVHTYYVLAGGAPVLVHNDGEDGGCCISTSSPGRMEEFLFCEDELIWCCRMPTK